MDHSFLARSSSHTFHSLVILSFVSPHSHLPSYPSSVAVPPGHLTDTALSSYTLRLALQVTVACFEVCRSEPKKLGGRAERETTPCERRALSGFERVYSSPFSTHSSSRPQPHPTVCLNAIQHQAHRQAPADCPPRPAARSPRVAHRAARAVDGHDGRASELHAPTGSVPCKLVRLVSFGRTRKGLTLLLFLILPSSPPAPCAPPFRESRFMAAGRVMTPGDVPQPPTREQ